MTFMKKHTSPPAAAFSVFLFLLISGAFFPGIFPSLCAASGEDGFENALHLTRDQMEKGDFLSAHKALLEAEKSAFSPERKGEVRYLEGDLLIREKRLDDAGRILENLASDKDAPKDWRLKAIELWSGIYDSSGDLPQAIRILEKKLAVEGLSDQERASILHALHLRQMQAGKIADAKESLARITHLQRLPAYEKSEYFLLLASLLHREKAYHYARLECGKGIYLLKNELKKAQDREDREEAERLSKRICRLQAELIRIHSDEGQTETPGNPDEENPDDGQTETPEDPDDGSEGGTPEEPDETEENGGSGTAVILLIVFVLLVAGGIGAVIFLKKKKKKNQN